MTDIVNFKLPLGVFGDLLAGFYVKDKVKIKKLAKANKKDLFRNKEKTLTKHSRAIIPRERTKKEKLGGVKAYGWRAKGKESRGQAQKNY